MNDRCRVESSPSLLGKDARLGYRARTVDPLTREICALAWEAEIAKDEGLRIGLKG